MLALCICCSKEDSAVQFLHKVVLELSPCPLGCPPGEEPVVQGHDRLHNLPGLFHVVRCNSCGLMRTDPRPTSESIGYYYPEDYGPYLSTRDVRESLPELTGWKQRINRALFATEPRPLPPLRP